MANTPNRIVLKGQRGRYDEGHANQPLWPGMIVEKLEDGGLVPHGLYGGAGDVKVVVEDGNRGGTINTVFNAGNDGCPLHRPGNGDELLLLLQNGANAPAQANLISAGDGTVIPDTFGPLLENAAPGSDTTKFITNTASETSFADSTFSFAGGSDTTAANTINVGHVLKISGQMTLMGKNAADTQVVKVYVGSAVITFPAVSLNVGDVFGFDISVVFTAIGASGKMSGNGTYWYGPPANPTVVPWTMGQTAIDTTAAIVVKVTATASAANAANKITMNHFRLEVDRDIGLRTLFVSEEAIDNSAGTGTSGYNHAAFIRATRAL